jgi:hypothetical protein
MFRDITITVTSVTVTDDGLGNTTETTTNATVPGVLFAPRSSSERTDSRTPAVITGGTIYKRGPGLTVDANDRITISGVSPMIDGTWQVEGEPGYWGAGTEVAVVRATNA